MCSMQCLKGSAALTVAVMVHGSLVSGESGPELLLIGTGLFCDNFNPLSSNWKMMMWPVKLIVPQARLDQPPVGKYIDT